MEFIVKKTTELTEDEVLRILYIFKEVFDVDRSVGVFHNQFDNTPMGYSLHLLMLEDGVIVGSHTYLPCYFMVDGKRMKFVSGADTMILKGHRDIFNYMDMLAYGRKYLKENGYAVDYGYPNEMNHQIFVKSKLTKDIGLMDTYCLPYRIGGIKKGLGFMNWASMMFCYIWVWLSSLFASEKVAKFRFAKELDSYNQGRYKRDDGIYCEQDGFVYKIKDYEGIRAAFLIDVYEKSAKNFCKAVKYILKHESDKFDILLYPGVLPFGCSGMIKIPHKFEPKHFYVVCKVINKKEVPVDDLFDINNWDTNLSNYDLI